MSHGEVCTLLSEHKYVVKSDIYGGEKLTGVSIPVEYESNELPYLLM